MKKLVSKRGFTLAEMLIAVLLLGIVTAMEAVITSAVLNNTVMAKEMAQAEILGSEALDNIQAELRFAMNIKVGDGVVTFNHDKANEGCVLALNDEGRIILEIKQPDGSVNKDELFVGVSYGNLTISQLTFEEDKAQGSVKTTVYVSFGDKALWSGSVSVRPINGMGE